MAENAGTNDILMEASTLSALKQRIEVLESDQKILKQKEQWLGALANTHEIKLRSQSNKILSLQERSMENNLIIMGLAVGDKDPRGVENVKKTVWNFISEAFKVSRVQGIIEAFRLGEGYSRTTRLQSGEKKTINFPPRVLLKCTPSLKAQLWKEKRMLSQFRSAGLKVFLQQQLPEELRVKEEEIQSTVRRIRKQNEGEPDPSKRGAGQKS